MDRLKFIITGHIDHGKSTLIGRLLYDTHSLPRDRVKEIMGSNFRKRDFSHFLDSFKEERERNLTIETTQVFLKSRRREYLIIDSPGHREFIKNMLTGACYAQAGVLVIDASEGIKEQTKRHAYILSLLGIKNVIVAINKMDLVNHSKEVFERIRDRIEEFLNNLKIKSDFYIPLSALKGENIVRKSKKISWFRGPALVEALDSLEIGEEKNEEEMIFSLQDSYNINNKKIFVGRVESGRMRKGDLVKVLPGGRLIRLKSIEIFNVGIKQAEKGDCVGITIDECIDLKRGDILCSPQKEISASDYFRANIFILSEYLNKEKRLTLRCSTQRASAKIEEIEERIDSSTLEILQRRAHFLRSLEIGRVKIKTDDPIVIKKFPEIEELGRFVLILDGDICAAGIISDQG